MDVSHTDIYLQFQHEHPEEAERIRRLVQEGRTHLENGKPDEARHAFVKVLAIFPYVPAALTNLAAIALLQKNPDQAEEYLSQALRHFPYDPSVHSVAMRLWLQRGSLPYVQYHAQRAVEGLRRLSERDDLLANDPSLFDRARTIVISTLTLFQSDHIMAEVQRLLPEVAWSEQEWTYFGIALFNLGEFDRAEEAWTEAQGEVGSPSAIYLFFLDLVRTGVLYPFMLDYNLNARLPSVEELQQAIEEHVPEGLMGGERRSLRLVKGGDEDEGAEASVPEQLSLKESQQLLQAMRLALPRHVPTLAICSGLFDIFEGEEEEAELALSILFFERWPLMPQLLKAVQQDEELTYRVRLNAALYHLWLGGADEVRRFLNGVDAEALGPDDRFILHNIWIQLALLDEDVAAARYHEIKAQPLLEQLSGELDAWVHVFNELSLRVDQLARTQAPQGEADATLDAPVPQAPSDVDKIIPFLPRHLRRKE